MAPLYKGCIVVRRGRCCVTDSEGVKSKIGEPSRQAKRRLWVQSVDLLMLGESSDGQFPLNRIMCGNSERRMVRGRACECVGGRE